MSPQERDAKTADEALFDAINRELAWRLPPT